MSRPKIKICGLTRQRDATACKELGIDFCGFIFHPDSPRNVKPETASVLDTGPLLRIGVFVNQSAEEVRHIMDFADLDMAQLAGGQDEEFCAEVGPARVIRVFWPERYSGAEDLSADLRRFAGYSAYYLLDAGKSGGGSGRSLDFSRLQELDPPKPWFLAGGLGPHNAADAVSVLSPFALDLNSGVEVEPGIKSRQKIEETLDIIKDY
jgi:phosphoribosylanthranilate isomerase